ncbi:hypothetical protein ACRE_087140 [Hapsidospora chrysogenum ATCC 11550]|uniref:Uncharacterized protein n=1 Tax=Hapsidospora chrysogenum (strain ATCC 11550 / CBS 779.69 / DSM 880 / IAM 14645 / JCM 23072 / IMI 49137) TaxID=857340 RepID=A0A086SU09_HAPC1|nr:hypothetical protein ACRE_087140 [Hapsidospora chrysogenum ATCC 11550]
MPDIHLSLPVLTPGATPIRHPDCCLSLSFKLLDVLTRIFTDSSSPTSSPSPSACILSVGSGSGLLEAALLAHPAASGRPRLTIEGVEVQQPPSQAPVNRYLPEPFHHTVRGTWDVSPRLNDHVLSELMFVYPRQPALVSRYVGATAEEKDGSSSIRTAVWLGPVADWDEFRPCFEGGGGSAFTVETRTGRDAGLEEFEMMAIMTR